MIMKTLRTIYTNFAKRLVMLFILLVAIGIGNGYAAQETLSGSFTSSNRTSGGFTATGGSVGSYYKLQTGYIISDDSYSVDATQSISISMKVGTFGSYSANKQSVDFYAVDKNDNIISNKVTASFSKANSSGTNFSGTITLNSGISGDDVRFKFASNSNATSTVCARFYNFTITYESAPSTFTVTYDANDATEGSVPEDNTEYASGASVTVLDNTGNLVKDGYSFDGWQIDKTGTVYTAGQTFNISSNVTLYAKWTEKALTNYRTSCTTETAVTLDPNGGAISEDGWETTDGGDTYTKNVETTSAVTLPTPTKDGYEFGGWYEYPEFTGSAVTAVPEGTEGEKTYYAKWNCIAPTSVTVTPTNENGWRYSIGETISLEATATGGSADAYSYQWQKYIESDWEDIDGATSQVYIKESCGTGDGGTYRCVVSTGDVCSKESEGFWVRVFTLAGNFESNSEWNDEKIIWSTEDNQPTIGTVTLTLPANATYEFKVTDNEGRWFGNPWTINATTDWWGFGVDDDNCTLQTKQAGEYIFTIDVEHAGDSEGTYVNVKVTFPTTQIIYFKPATSGTWADNAKFTIYSWGSGDPSYTPLQDKDCGGIYSAEISTTHTSLLFIKASTYKENFDNITAQTIDLTAPTGDKVLYDMTLPNSTHLFLTPNHWANDGARFAAYFFGNGTRWVDMTKINDKVTGEVTYMCAKPTDTSFSKVIFGRMNPSNSTNDFNTTKWNQSGDLTIPTNGGNLLTVPNGSWDGFTTIWSTVYGDWTTYTPNRTVTFDTKGHGTAPEDQCITDGGKATNPGNLSATGYTFGGWYTDQACNNAWDFENDVVTEDITLYAKWTANIHTLMWDVNGGNDLTGTYTSGSVAYGTVIVPPATPTRTGYTFNGWSPAFEEGTTMPDDDLTYTAQWKFIPTLSWSASSCTAALEADNDYPYLTTNPADLTGITYSSSNTSVATIDDNTGVITLVGVGETTITASFAGDGIYAPAADASYTLTVVESNCKWVEVEIGDIDENDQVVIAMAKTDGTKTWALDNSETGTYPAAGALLVEGNKISQPLDRYIWNIVATPEGYVLYSYADKTTWLYCTGSNNTVKVGTGSDKKFVIENGYLKCSNQLTVSGQLVDAYIGVSSSTNSWRHYSNTTGVIKDQTLKFYKRECLDSEHYWVTWDANEGTWTDGSSNKLESYQVGATISEPTDPTREGYRFDGWIPTPETMPAQNITFTAVWTQMHTITWMVGSNSVLTEEVANATGVTKTPTDDPTDDAIGECANAFMGWSETPLGSAEGQSAPADLCTAAQMKSKYTSVTSDKTFYAVFATKGSGGIAQGTVLWAENFAHFGTNTPSTAGTGTGTTIYGDASITYSQSNNNTKGYDEEIAGGTKPELLLYKGGNHTWTIAGIPTGGAAKMTLSFLSNRTDFNVTSSTTGITVSGSEKTWNITANNDVTTFTLTIKNTNSDKNVRIDNVSVVVAEGGVSYSNYVTNCCNTPAPTNGAYTSVSGTEIKLTWDDAANTNHYHITGGNLSAEGVYSDNKYCNITGLTECEEYTFYVSAHPAEGCESAAIQISAQPFSGAKTVTFNPNGGAVSPTSFTTSCDKNSTTLPTPTNSGYRFMGWFTAANGGTEITGTSYTPTADITLFAHWEKEYTVTYDLQGGTASPVCSGDKYIAGEIVTICTSTPIKSGYKFTGWTYSPVVTITNGQFTMPASNVTITAEFVARAVTNIEVATNTHRVLMQGSAFIGEQIRVTYDNGETELLEWSNSKLTFAGHNTNELGVQTVTVTYTGEGTAHTQYNIEVIDGLGITFWDGDYTETIKYEPGDLVDVDSRIGQNICSGWEFAGWSETKVANESEEYVPVHNFNATDAKVLYAVYVKKKAQWTTIVTADEAKSGAKYVLAYDRYDTYYALTSSVKDVNYLAGKVVTSTEGELNSFDVYYLSAEPTADLIWELISTDENGKWYLYNKNTAKYIDLSTQGQIHLTDLPSDKLQMESGYNDSQIRIASSTVPTYYLSWDNSNTRYNTFASSNSQEYWYTKDEEFTSTPPCSPLSATFHGNGGIVTAGVNSGDDLTITEPTRDAGITTPTASFADCNGKSWTFVGWSREEIDVTRVPVLTTDLLHDGGGNNHYYIQEDGEEFWAVYTNTGDPETKYGTITFTDDDVTTQYENAKTITKSVTAMGDYDFELYHVSDASSLGIQFDHNSTPKGYIKNITSLGKINSISLNDFQVGDIDDVKVYVGNTSDAINILLTEADLQQTGNTYTYYPQKNYAYVKIEANGYCGITSISIDFGKGTQIWATTPDCSTITLSGDEIYITATNGRAIMASAPIAVKANQLEANANVILTSTSSDVYFSTDRTFNFAAGQAAGQKPTTSLTLPTDAEGNLATTDVYIHYMPSSEGDGVPANVIISANLETPNPSITDDHTIHVRNLPAKFVIATKVGATWYALPADMTDDTNPLAEVIEVDEATMTATAPNTTTYTLWPVKTTNGTGNRYADYGDRLRFAAVNYEQRGLWANNNNNSSAIRNYAVINSLGADGSAAYEWKVTTTVVDGHWQYTLQTDQAQNQNYLRYWTSAEGTPVGPKWGTYNAGENKLYFLPVTETQPFEYAVVEWYPTKVLIQTDAAIASPTVKVGGEKVESPELTIKGGKLYEISNLPLETNPNEVLQVSFTADAVNYVNAKVVPIILSREAKSITGEPFATLTQKVYQYADVVVRDGATLTIDGGTDVANTLLGMTIYPTAKVSVAEGKKLSVHNLTFFGGIDEIYDGSAYTINKYGVPQLSLKGILNKTVTNMDYIMRVNLDQMYQVGVPYDVNLSDITYWDGTAMELGEDLYISAYDGQKRANREEKSWVWEVNFTEPILKAGIGYTISADMQAGVGNEYSIIRMPMKNNITSGNTETAKTVQVYAYDNTKGVEITDNHKGWNYLSNPYMVAISGAEADSKLVVGYLRETGTGPWEWVDDTYRYVTIPSDDGKWYDQQKFKEATLLPFKSFFLQIATDGELSFALASRQSAPARYLQSSNEQREVEFEVLLANDTRSDNLGFLIGEDYTPAYEINADLEKMIGSMSVYTIYNGYNLAYNALSPANAEEQIPIGYVVPTVGEYTFALDESSDIEDVEHIYLIDYETSAITDLVTDVYTFTALEQKSDTRFAINVALKSKDNAATGLDNMNTNGELPTKFIYQDKIFILHHGVIYDATGKRVITINK